MCVKNHMKTYLIGHERREGIRVYQFLRGPLTDAFDSLMHEDPAFGKGFFVGVLSQPYLKPSLLDTKV